MTRKALPQFILLITLIAITAGAAIAQTHRKVTLEAQVPFEFVVGNRAFPAGTYVFEMATGTPRLTEQAGVLVVRNHERKLYAAVAADIAADANAHVKPRLVFARNGDRVYLSKVWRQGNAAGLSVPLAPGIASTEQEGELIMLDASVVTGAI